MRLPIIAALLLGACETMPSSGQPFAPAEVAPVATSGAQGPDATSSEATGPEGVSADPRFALFDEPFRISSEELAGGKAPASTEPEASKAPKAPKATTDGTADTASEGLEGDPLLAAFEALERHEAQPPAAATPQRSAPMSASNQAMGGWPLRLVSTVADAQPPRAILGLPDGREIVVSPGTMVPEVGVVVMAVGRSKVELARVQAAGDHALISSQTLSSQF